MNHRQLREELEAFDIASRHNAAEDWAALDRVRGHQRVLTVGMAKVALSMVASTCAHPKASLEAAVHVARHRAAHDDQGNRTRWLAIADLLDECARDTAVLTVAKVAAQGRATPESGGR